MKKLLSNLCMMTLFIVATSCNDDDVPVTRELLLTRVERNGITLLDFIFDTEKKLTRINTYLNGGEPGAYYWFEYDDEGIAELLKHDVNHSIDYKIVCTRDNFGRVIKGESYFPQSDFKVVNSLLSLSYDASDQLAKRQFTTGSNPVLYADEFTYGVKNHLTKRIRTYYPNQAGEFVGVQDDYTPGDKSIYGHWNNLVSALRIVGLDGYIWEILNTRNHHTNWNEDGEITFDTQTEASERQYNADGYLIRRPKLSLVHTIL